MDIFIIIPAAIFFVIFLFIQRTKLHTIPFEQRVSWQKKLLLKTTFTSWIVSCLMYGIFMPIPFAVELAVIISTVMFFSCAIYIATIFSFLESSITIKLLSLFSKQDTLTEPEIYKQYPLPALIERRMKRFEYEGIITYKKPYVYYHKQSQSLFIIRNYYARFIDLLFPHV